MVLAIAAYNCGPGKIKTAVRRLGNQSPWNLPLPYETKVYVPKLLAVAEIVKNPKRYGVELPKVSNQPYFTEVDSKKPVSLTKVAATSGVSVKTLTKLNPDYKQGPAAPNKNGVYKVLVPINTAPAVKENIANGVTKEESVKEIKKDVKTDVKTEVKKPKVTMVAKHTNHSSKRHTVRRLASAKSRTRFSYSAGYNKSRPGLNPRYYNFS